MNLPPFLELWPPDEIKLAGHRIGLFTVVRLSREGMSAAEIVEELPSLELGHVEQVLEFAETHRAEVSEYVGKYQAELDRQFAVGEKGPSIEELRRRWREKGLGPLPDFDL